MSGAEVIAKAVSDSDRRARNTTTTAGPDYPDGTHEDWTYHDDGRVANHTDGRGRTTAFRYNADDELWGPAGSGYVAVNYPNDTDVNLSRDMDGLITALTDGSGTSSATYYPSGWLKTFTNGVGKTVTYQYNGVGLVSRLTTPGSLNFDYTYNALNLPATIANPNGVTASFTYDNGGRRTRVTRPGSYIEYQYNARDWITAVLNRSTAGSIMCDARYYYQDGALWDHAGNPLKKVENWGGLDYPTTYRYDHVYRLTEDTRRDGQGQINWQYLFGYDQVGNRTSRTKNGVTVTYTYDNNDKLVSASNGSLFGYDGSGNMTSVSGPLGSWSLVYDDESRPSSITYPTGSDSFLWNALGQRMRATLSGAVKRYIYNGDRVLEQTDDAGNVAARYTTESGSYYQPLLHLWVASGSLSRHPLYDAQGTVRRLADDSGAKTDYYTHAAFGYEYPPTGATPNPYRFGGAWGYITDTPGSGLLQLGARFYWPEVGRFIQQDPIGEGMNWYAYVANNLLVWVDPEGLDMTIPGISGDPWLVFDPCSLDQLGMSAGATLTGLVNGGSLGAVPLAKYLGWLPPTFADWTDPDDPYAKFSKGAGTAAGASLTAAGIASALGAEANVSSRGNVLKVISRRLRVGFRLDNPVHGRWGHPHFWRWWP